MADTFITKIQVNETRNIRDFSIPLSESERKHLIITGKNGSGKTSLLDDLNKFLQQIDNGNYRNYQPHIDGLKSLEESRAQIALQPQSEQQLSQSLFGN